MKTKVQRWGNSLALRIPKPFAIETDLIEGASVDISLENGKIIVEKSTSGQMLEDLLIRITPDNIHAEIDYGDPIGNEVW
ncbi:MAG: AbrB/MazE/SpoVT family DNA-binding domain-containing protein [Anaerolineales bacterium]|jgi:antitoxin MazE|nr:MAG: AbrB/MazE/SpoVT family DNA-binding domain-containing protein [Anaerolineales bacterium]